MRIDILTLFPHMFDGFLNESIIKRAIESKKIEINIIDFREYSPYKNKQVDDYPYGGGSGMLLMCEPIFLAIDDLRGENTKVLMMTPSGKTFNQNMAYKLSEEQHLIILCGHYEGFDERIKTIIDEEISIGEYVLTGGELPSMVITDAVVRLVDGVIKKESLEYETYTNDQVDFPQYTKPRIFRDMEVPEVLLSGHHENIRKYRELESEKLTSKLKNKKDGE